MMNNYVLLFIICVVSYVIYVKINTNSILSNTVSRSRNDIINLADNGDLIYFRWNTVSFLHNIISPFTHIGVVIIKDNKKYIVETHSAGDTYNFGIYTGGVHIYPLNIRLNTYNGDIYLSQLKEKYRPNKIIIDDFVLHILKSKLKIPFYNEYVNYFTSKCLAKRNLKLTIKPKVGMFCSEFVGYCLKELKIVNNDFDYNCLAPGDFRYIKNDDNTELLYNDKLIKLIKLDK